MTFLADVTPVILTYNEAPNIGRVLDRLDWAKDIVVLDSGSTDETVALCGGHPNVRVLTRPFDTHAQQWNHAIHETGVSTPWVLAMDADYVLTPEAEAEIAALRPDQDIAGYWLSFRYAIAGVVLRSGVYPPVLALLRRERARHVQDGHTQRAVVEGKTGRIGASLIHDDRKPLGRWMASQLAYARLEADKAEAGGGSGFKAWVRNRTPFGPVLIALHILVFRGALFEGPAGWFYAAQRTLAEALITCARLERRFAERAPGDKAPPAVG